MPTSSTDPRYVRSREQLLAAGTALMEAVELDSISITAVVKAAGVTRPTFYQHFSDLASLYRCAALQRLEAAFPYDPPTAESLDGASQAQWTDAVDEVVQGLLHHLHLNSGFYRRAFFGPSARELHGDAVRLLVRQLVDRSPLGPALHTGPIAQDDLANVIAGGIVWLILGWLDSDFENSNTVRAMSRRVSVALVTLSGVISHD